MTRSASTSSALTVLALVALTLSACGSDDATPTTSTLERFAADGQLVDGSYFDDMEIRVEAAASGTIRLDSGFRTTEARDGQRLTASLRGPALVLAVDDGGVAAAATALDVLVGEEQTTLLVIADTVGGTARARSTTISSGHELIDAWQSGDQLGIVSRSSSPDTEIVVQYFDQVDRLRLDTRVTVPLVEMVDLGAAPRAAVELPDNGEIPITAAGPGSLSVRVLDDATATLVGPDGREAFDTDPSTSGILAQLTSAGTHLVRVEQRTNSDTPATAAARPIVLVLFGAPPAEPTDSESPPTSS